MHDQISGLRDKFEQAYDKGQRPLLNELLAGTAPAQRSQLLFELLPLDVASREKAGEHPQRHEYIEQFPELRQVIDEFFAARETNVAESATSIAQHATLPPQPTPNHDAAREDATLPPAIDSTASPAERGTLPLSDASKPVTDQWEVGGKVRYFGDYELLQEIARGGMGVVYKARQTKLNRIVALKMILSGQLAGEEEVQRFHAEAEAAANLDHPGIVPIFEVGEYEGQHFFSMGFVEGESLSDKIQDGPLPPLDAATYTQKVAQAVAYAHQRGVIHRDLKPANVLVDQSGQPKVTDFGLAKKTKQDSGLTASGQVLGTPSYMPPEQASGKLDEITETADVYSIGAILYCLLTGRPPFQSSSPMDTLMQVLQREPVSPQSLNPKTPKDLATIALKCLEKNPRRRYASATELADELGRYLRDEPILARPISRPARLWRWCKRKPVVSSLSAAVLALLLFVTIAAPLAAWNQATLREQAEAARTKIAEQEAQAVRALYARTISLAYQEWSANNVNRAEQLLDSTPNVFRGWEWDYLKALCHSELTTLRGHRGIVRDVHFSSDGKQLTSFGVLNTVKVWDAETGHAKNSFDAAGLAVSHDGQLLAVHDGGKVRLIRTSTGDEVAVLAGHINGTQFASFSPNDQQLVTCGANRSVKVWDLASGEQLLEIPQPDQPTAHDVTFSPDGKQLAWKTQEGFLVVHDASTGDQHYRKREDRGGTVPFVNVAFHPEGTQLATCGFDGNIRLYDAASFEQIAILRGHKGFVYGVAFSPDGGRIVSGASDTTIRIWDLAQLRQIMTLRGHGVGATYGVFDVTFSPDGQRIASGGADTTVKIWDAYAHGREASTEIESPTTTPASELRPMDNDDRSKLLVKRDPSVEYSTISRHTWAVESFDFSPDGTKIVTGSWDATVKVHDVQSGRELLSFEEHQQRVGPVAFSPDGKWIASATGGQLSTTGGDVFVWEADSGKVVHKFTAGAQQPAASRLAFLPDGKRLIVACGSQLNPSVGAITLYDLEASKQVGRLSPVAAAVRGLAMHPDGKLMATSGHDGNVIIWDVDTGTVKQTLPFPSIAFFGLDFSPDGKYLAGGGTDWSVRLWQASDWKEVFNSTGHNGAIFDIEFAPDGKRFASACIDSTIRIWDPQTGNDLLTMRGHDHEIMGVAFSPDGKLLASSSYDGTVNIRGGTDDVVPNTDNWVRLFADDFNRSDVGYGWQPLTGKWTIENGALKGVFAPWRMQPQFKFALAVPANQYMPSTVEVAFDVWTPSRQICEVKLADLASDLTRNNLVGMFMTTSTPAYNNNVKGTLITVATSGSYSKVAGNDSVWMEPNVKYRVRIIRQPRRMHLFVDGKHVISARTPLIDAPYLHMQGGFADAGESIHFDNVEIRVPKESVAESEALRLVEPLFEATLDKDLVARQINEDQTIEPNVREPAMEILARKTISPVDFNQQAWSVARDSNRSQAEYEHAAKLAAAAHRALPSDKEILNTLAVAQYRAGQFERAKRTIQLTLDEDHADGHIQAVNLIFAAMIHEKLADHEKADFYLDWAGEQMLETAMAHNAEAQRFYGEAKILVGDAADRRQQIILRLKKLAQAMHEFHDAKGHYPAHAIVDSSGEPLLSWRVELLPYLGANELYEKFHLDESWDSPHNRLLLQSMPDVFKAGSDRGGAGETYFQVFVGPGTIFEKGKQIRIGDIVDGTADTILIAEAAQAVPWTQSADLAFDPSRTLPTLGSGPTARASFVLASGSGGTVHRDLIATVLKGAITRYGSEPQAAWYGPPAWDSADKHPPLDVGKYLGQRKLPRDDPSGEIRHALAQLEQIGEQANEAASWENLESSAPTLEQVDALLELARPALDRLDELQARHDRIVFVGQKLQAPLRLPALRALDRMTRLEIYRASKTGDGAAALKAIARLLRMTRDLRIRNPLMAQAVATSIDKTVFRCIAGQAWQTLTPDECDTLINLLQQHRQDVGNPFYEGAAAEYIHWRDCLWELQHRHLPLRRLMNITGHTQLSLVKLVDLDWDTEIATLNDGWRRYLETVALPPHEMLKDRRYSEYAANLKEKARKAELTTDGIWSHSVLAARIIPNEIANGRVIVGWQMRLAGVTAGTCIRRYTLTHGDAPPNLATACRDAGVKLPSDPFDGEAMRYAIVDGKPTVYSVGSDGRSAGGKLDLNQDVNPGYQVPDK